MLKNIFLLFLLSQFLLLNENSYANDSVATKEYLIVQPIGIYKLKVGSNDKQGYSISVFNQNGKKIQTFDVLSSAPLDSLILIVDVDGDGYKDIVIANSIGVGPFPDTSLYRFNSYTKLFEEDKSFPGNGFPTPSSKKGCIYLEERQPGGNSNFYYAITEWCLSTKSNNWVAGKSCDNHTIENCPFCSQEITKACYKDLSNFQKNWWRKYQN